MQRPFPLPAFAVVVSAIAFVVSPLFSDGFNGFTAEQFPIPQRNMPVQPAGYAFAIWGVIYLWLVAGAVFGLLLRPRAGDWGPMRWPLAGSLGIGAGWIAVAQSSPLWATGMIWTMLILALLALNSAGKSDRWWQRAPLALYAGWLTAASCVALGLVLGGYGWLGPVAAALTMIALALAIALTVQSQRPDEPLYTVSVVWALVGVMAANTDPVQVSVLAVCALGIAVLGWRAWRLR